MTLKFLKISFLRFFSFSGITCSVAHKRSHSRSVRLARNWWKGMELSPTSRLPCDSGMARHSGQGKVPDNYW